MTTGHIERGLALVGATAVVLVAAAGGGRLLRSAGLAVDDSMERLFVDT